MSKFKKSPKNLSLRTIKDLIRETVQEQVKQREEMHDQPFPPPAPYGFSHAPKSEHPSRMEGWWGESPAFNEERLPQRSRSKQAEPHGLPEWEDDWMMMEPRAPKARPRHKEKPPMDPWDYPYHPEMMESPMRPNRKPELRNEWESPNPKSVERSRKQWEEMPNQYDETALLNTARRKKKKR